MMVMMLTRMSILIVLIAPGWSSARDDLRKNPTASNSNHDRRKLIIHGEIAEPGRYPYFTTLEHNCGGALIAPDIVLTAGHCKDRHLKAAVGRYSFAHDRRPQSSGSSSSWSSFAGYYDVIAQARHPRWMRKGDDEFEHDFLLLKLNQTLHNRPIAHLNDNPDRPHIGHGSRSSRSSTSGDDDEVVTAMGVGWTHRDRESSADTLRAVQLNPISNEQCRASANEESSYRKRIFPSHLCTTSGENNDRDACAYDSGSPIIIPGEDGDPDVIVALVSWGEGCADPDFPGVNARVSDAFEWLRVNVCVMSDAPPDYLCGASAAAPFETPTASSKPLYYNFDLARWVDIAWKIVSVFLGIGCAVLLYERGRGRRSHSNSHKHWLDSPGSSLDERECLNAEGPYLNRYESLKGVEVSTFSALSPT